MLASFRSLLSGSTSRVEYANYAPIASEEGAPPQPAPRREADLRTREGRDVYICFWALGAGILLPWNGKLVEVQRS